MYLITRNGRPAGNKKYSTYEKARQRVRSFLRDLTSHRYQRQPDVIYFTSPYKIIKVD